VNPEFRFSNQPKDLLDPNLARVAHLLSRSCNVAGVVDREDQGVKIGRQLRSNGQLMKTFFW
jgi:hypothetical protein